MLGQTHPLSTRPPESAARCSRLSSSLVVAGTGITTWYRSRARAIALSSFLGCTRTLTHRDRAEREARGFERSLEPSASPGNPPDSVYPRTDLAGRSSLRISVFISCFLNFCPPPVSCLRRARRRASLREPQQQCSAVTSEPRVRHGRRPERMLRSRGEKGDCGYIREACTMPPVFHGIVTFLAEPGNKEGSLGAIPTTAARCPPPRCARRSRSSRDGVGTGWWLGGRRSLQSFPRHSSPRRVPLLTLKPPLGFLQPRAGVTRRGDALTKWRRQIPARFSRERETLSEHRAAFVGQNDPCA